MSVDIDELGPFDYLLVEFAPGTRQFSDEMAAELALLADTELIRILDILILEKDRDGNIEAYELDELDQVDDLRGLEAEIAEFLGAADVVNLAAAMEPGSVAGVVIWENRWAPPFASAVRHAGGQLIASGRITIQAILASLESDDDHPTENMGA